MEEQDETTVVVRGKFINFITNQAKLHGLPIILLLLGVYYFHGENIRMRSEIRSCNDSLVQMYRDDRVQMMQIINNNTEALQRIGIYQIQNSNTSSK